MDNGGLGDIGRNLIILVPMILLVLFNIFRKRRRGERTQSEIVISLLSEIGLNQQIVEVFLQRGGARKLKIGSWQRNKDKLEFFDQKLQECLAKTFNMVEEFNRATDAARKFKSSSYLVGIPMDKLKESLTLCRQGIEEWLRLNEDQIQMTTGRRGGLLP